MSVQNLPKRSNSVNINSEKYLVSCQKKISSSSPTTKEWLEILKALKPNNFNDTILLGILEKWQDVVIKISEKDTLQKEYNVSELLHQHQIPGVIRYICFFTCQDTSINQERRELCRGEGSSLKVLVMPYLNLGSISNYNWKNDIELRSCIKQIILTTISLFTTEGILHNDLHSDNVLLNRTVKKSVIYDINGTKIEVECNGLNVVFLDFENSLKANIGSGAELYVFKDIINALSDLYYKSNIVDISGIMQLCSFIDQWKSLNFIQFYSETLPLIENIQIQPKKKMSFVYDPTFFGGSQHLKKKTTK
jgi:serine/threonine protein kinase